MYKIFFFICLVPFFGLLAKEADFRDYTHEIRSHEVADITYIVTTLSDKPAYKLPLHAFSLLEAGDRVIHLHPLNFLRAVFTSEVLKVKIRNVRKKGLAWNSFLYGRSNDGLANSFDEELAEGNLPTLFIDDFANHVGISAALLYPAVETRNWEKFVDTLIQHVPRGGDGDRYDM